MTTEKQTTTKKKAPTHNIYPTGADGKLDYTKGGVGFAHSKGGGVNFIINGQRWTSFPAKPKAAQQSEQPAEGEGA